MASGDDSPSKISGPPRTKIIEEKHSYSKKKLIEDYLNSSVHLPTPTSNSLPELTNTVERYAAILNKDQIITTVKDIL